jgi:aspartyl/asparaginyl-tRNA synthetase
MDATHETKMFERFGSTMITDFPEMTSPFWNMSRNEGGATSKKIDVILGGMETIGSAERSCDVDMMRDTFHTIVDGEYAQLLYKLFGKDRVEAELEELLKFDFFQRVGGGIGMTRMIAALDKQGKFAQAA